MPILSGELTKSIKRCYPPGRQPDKHPLPSELSMLIFLLQTRPAKITKAGLLLLARAQSYASKDQTGNLLVTLEIIHEMILKLSAYLNLFAVQALNIVSIVTEKACGPDTTLTQPVSLVFQDFNKHHNGVLFSGHNSYAQEFLATTAKFSRIAKAKDPHSAGFALDALRSLGGSAALTTRTGQDAVHIAMGGVEANLPTANADSYNQESSGPEKTQAEAHKRLADRAISALQAFVDTTYFEQITSVISSILEWLGKSEGLWQQSLLVAVARWVPPQNRFVVTRTLVNEMSLLPANDVKQQRIYTTYLNALLRADESKVGLSAVDVQRQLIGLQQRLITRTPEAVDGQSIQDLIVQLRSNIGSLATLDIYPGQVADMIDDILSRYVRPGAVGYRGSNVASSATRKFSTASVASGADRPLGVVLNDLYDIREILHETPVEQKLTMDHLQNTPWLLTSNSPQLLTFYTLTFVDYNKAAVPIEHPESKKGSLVLRQLCQVLLDPDTPKEPANYIAVYYCIVALVEHLGAAAPTVIPWILKIVPEEADYASADKNFVNVCLTSVVLGSLLAVSRAVDNKEVAEKLFELISSRVHGKTWLPGIIYPTTVPVERAIGVASKSPIPTFDVLDFHTVDVSALGLVDAADIAAIQHPGFELDEPLGQEDFSVIKNKAPSIAAASAASGFRNFSGRSLVSLDQAPKVAELRRRQTDTQSVRSVNIRNGAGQSSFSNHKSLPPGRTPSKTTTKVNQLSGALTNGKTLSQKAVNGDEATSGNGDSHTIDQASERPQPPSDGDLLSILESVDLNEASNKGRLTV